MVRATTRLRVIAYYYRKAPALKTETMAAKSRFVSIFRPHGLLTQSTFELYILVSLRKHDVDDNENVI